MDKRPLKLKLKIGGPPTPETDTKFHQSDAKNMAEEDPALGSDDEVEEDEWAEDGQVCFNL